MASKDFKAEPHDFMVTRPPEPEPAEVDPIELLSQVFGPPPPRPETEGPPEGVS